MNAKSSRLAMSPVRSVGSSNVSSAFLDEILVDFGPAEIIGRFFLKACEAALQRGVLLSFATFGDLDRVNRELTPDWPLLPMFRPDAPGLRSDQSLCILGRNVNGEVVATQAARLYDWTDTNLHHEAESLALFYGRGIAPTDAKCVVSGATARGISGRVVYSGGGWYRPDFRGCMLSAILPRISRTFALTRWDTDFTISFVDWQIVKKGVASRYGYKRVDDGIRMQNIVSEDFHGGIAWMARDELVADLQWFNAEFPIRSIEESSKDAVTRSRTPVGSRRGAMMRR